jgi:hypothetical protein
VVLSPHDLVHGKAKEEKLISKLVLAITLAVGGAYPTPVVAEDNWGLTRYLQTVTPNLVNFIEDNSNYIYGGWAYPEIIIDTPKEICAVVYEKPRPECDIAGYYNDDDNTIHIRNSPTKHMTDNRFFEVVLVHELVHFLQYHDGTYEEVTCRQELEKDAFMIQDKFVKQQGIDLQQAPDPLFSLLMSSCPRDMPFMSPGGG